jgi:non-homologous end joining protein Ku
MLLRSNPSRVAPRLWPIVNQKASTFEPEKFEDHYEEALTELINAKRNGKTVGAKPRPKGENVVDFRIARGLTR